MSIGIALAWMVTVGSLAALLWALIRMSRSRRREGTWQNQDDSVSFSLADFSLDRYQPMGRLLAEEDLLFLKAQPGYQHAMGVRWKRERRRLFRLYLRELKGDFRRLHAHTRALIARSETDSSDLVQVLMKQQIMFLWTTSYLEFRLVLQQLGIGKADVTRFIEMIEGMRVDLVQRTAPQAV
jgi:hypothetical protein